MLTHNARSTRGASLLLLCRDSADHSGMSGIPVQNLKRKANATPKYRCLGTHTVTRTRIGVTYPEQVRRLPEQMLRSQLIGTEYLIQGWYLAPSTRCLVHGTWYLEHCTGCQVPATWYQVLGPRYAVPGTRYQVRGTRYQAPGTRYKVHQAPDTRYLVPDTW